ncbi:hypothetical protein BYT27DRAFT_7343190 [Phlegmacium glaucopus]|nr:hypothetical protein BYT27DRAFT_7343190 [Phlegmacium glaucopus]
MSIVFSKGFPSASSTSMDPPKKSPAKPPLITPSASPSPRPSLFSHAYNNRLPDAAPPVKRQRLVSTHRAPHDTSYSSTSRPQSPAGVQREREASKLRLLDVWSSLAERYTRRLDEDDIVDIRTGKITQDRGFIRNSRKVNFGAIAAPVTGDAMADEGTDVDEEDEYDTDELDAFADATSEIDNAEHSEIGLRLRPVPPVTAMDSADAEDLRAFLEAERRRKQLCGSDVEEDDYSSPNTPNQDSEVEDESAADSKDLDLSSPNDAADASGTYPGSQTAFYVDSEDELDNWDIDESSVVYPVLQNEDNDSDIEIIDGPTVSPSKSRQMLKPNLQVENNSQTHQEQLHTPPLSHLLPVTPSENRFVHVSSPLSPPMQKIPSSETLAQRVASVPLSPKPSSIRTALGNTPGPRLDLTQVLKVKKPARNDSTSHRSPNNRISTSNVRTPSVKPYVLLTPRKSTGLGKFKTEKQNFDLNEGQETDVFKVPNLPKAIDKGKAKAKTDGLFEAVITAKAATSEGGKVFATNKVKERRRRSNSENKAHTGDPLAVLPSQVDSPPRIDERRSSSMSPSKPHLVNNRKGSQHETLREGSRSPSPSGSFSGGITLNTLGRQSLKPRKRKRVSSDSGAVFAVETSVMQREEKPERHFTPRRTSFSDDLPYHENQASTFYMISEKKLAKPRSKRQSSSRSRRRPESSVSSSGSESGNSPDSERGYSCKPTRSHYNNFQFPHHYPYPPHQSYRKQQRQHPRPPEMFAPPLPDPRAQFIITQAMQQLSALVGTPWTPPHDSPSVPYTPSRRHQSIRANSIFNTPSYRPHPYPYSYDPNLSHATLPPESPESASSPEKSSQGPRKSSMARSRSRGRRVSFKIDDESGDGDGGRDLTSSPSNISSSRREAVREKGRQNTTKPAEGKGKARAETPASEPSSEDPLGCGNGRDGKSYSRGRTPGPNIGSPKGMKRGQNSQRRRKST